MSGIGRLSLRIDLPQGRIGPGKIALLEAIGAEGSISAAARAQGMSYRRAWALVESIREVLGEAAVAASPGGKGGGGAALTAAGVQLMADYRAIERAAARVAARRLARITARSERG